LRGKGKTATLTVVRAGPILYMKERKDNDDFQEKSDRGPTRERKKKASFAV